MLANKITMTATKVTKNGDRIMPSILMFSRFIGGVYGGGLGCQGGFFWSGAAKNSLFASLNYRAAFFKE